MSRRPTIPFRDAITDLKTGDLIFGRGLFWTSRLIELFTGGTWSHVGMVVRPQDLDPNAESNAPLLWEATSVKGDDVDGEKGRTGAMLVLLEPRIEEYFGSGSYKLMGLRCLHGQRNEHFYEGLRRFIVDETRVRKADYPEEWDILKDFFEHRYLRTIEQGTFFCSELIAATYAEAGVMASTPDPQSYSPRDFSERGYLPILRRYRLGQERWLSAN